MLQEKRHSVCTERRRIARRAFRSEVIDQTRPPTRLAHPSAARREYRRRLSIAAKVRCRSVPLLPAQRWVVIARFERSRLQSHQPRPPRPSLYTPVGDSPPDRAVTIRCADLAAVASAHRNPARREIVKRDPSTQLSALTACALSSSKSLRTWKTAQQGYLMGTQMQIYRSTGLALKDSSSG